MSTGNKLLAYHLGYRECLMLYMRMFEFFNGVMLHENGNASDLEGCNAI